MFAILLPADVYPVLLEPFVQPTFCHYFFFGFFDQVPPWDLYRFAAHPRAYALGNTLYLRFAAAFALAQSLGLLGRFSLTSSFSLVCR